MMLAALKARLKAEAVASFGCGSDAESITSDSGTLSDAAPLAEEIVFRGLLQRVNPRDDRGLGHL